MQSSRPRASLGLEVCEHAALQLHLPLRPPEGAGLGWAGDREELQQLTGLRVCERESQRGRVEFSMSARGLPSPGRGRVRARGGFGRRSRGQYYSWRVGRGLTGGRDYGAPRRGLGRGLFEGSPKREAGGRAEARLV